MSLNGDDDIVDSDILFEIAIDVFYFYKYRDVGGDRYKNRYFHRLWDFILKFKRKHPEMSDEKVSNFIRIYLLYEPTKGNFLKSEYLFDGLVYIYRLSWVGPYLQEHGDYKYSWLIENLGKNLHHPSFFSFLAY